MTNTELIAIAAILVDVLLCVIGGLVHWGLKNAIGRITDSVGMIKADLEKHLASCSEHINGDALELRLRSLEFETSKLPKYRHWVANTVFLLAIKCGIELKPQPD